MAKLLDVQRKSNVITEEGLEKFTSELFYKLLAINYELDLTPEEHREVGRIIKEWIRGN